MTRAGYGEAHLHLGGLPALLGPPVGMTREELERQVEREHTDVDDDEWGGSEREFKNGNCASCQCGRDPPREPFRSRFAAPA